MKNHVQKSCLVIDSINHVMLAQAYGPLEKAMNVTESFERIESRVFLRGPSLDGLTGWIILGTRTAFVAFVASVALVAAYRGRWAGRCRTLGLLARLTVKGEGPR